MSDPSNKTDKARRPKRDYITRSQVKHLAREAILEELGPSRKAVFGLFLTLLLLVGAVVWSNFVPVTTATTTIGEVVPSGNQRIVQHLEGGIVDEILVGDGDRVSVGDVLLRFNATQRDAELGQIRARQAALRIREIRLRAQINDWMPAFSDLGRDYPELVAEARVTLTATRERVAGQISVLESKIEQRKRAVDVFRNQGKSLQDQRRLVSEAVDMRAELFETGHGSRVNLISSQLELARVEGSLAEINASIAQAEIAIEEANNELNELIVTERDNALGELSSVLGELAEVNENLRRVRDRVTRLEVVAPVDGIVHGSTVNTRGAVVEPAAILMTIIPVDETLVVETEIPPEEIGHVSTGQQTKVAINGFDQRRYGHLPGTLVRLSPTTFINDEGEPYFKGRIELARNAIATDDVETPIVPGMTVTADIVTGEQSLLHYMTGPIYEAVTTSFSER